MVVLDTDWGTWSTDSDDTDIERRLARFLAETFLHNGCSGRKLYRLFKQQMLTDISFEVFPLATTNYALARQVTQAEGSEREALKASVITAQELQRWQTGLEKADSEGIYFSSVNLIMIAGCKK